jgi:hypothetical protein
VPSGTPASNACQPARFKGGALLAAASCLLLLLAAAQGYVSFRAQYAFVDHAKRAHIPSVLEAVGLDTGAVIFALLALSLARRGRPGTVERVLNVACALGSLTMNLLAANLTSPRSITVWVLPSVPRAAWRVVASCAASSPLKPYTGEVSAEGSAIRLRAGGEFGHEHDGLPGMGGDRHLDRKALADHAEQPGGCSADRDRLVGILDRRALMFASRGPSSRPGGGSQALRRCRCKCPGDDAVGSAEQVNVAVLVAGRPRPVPRSPGLVGSGPAGGKRRSVAIVLEQNAAGVLAEAQPARRAAMTASRHSARTLPLISLDQVRRQNQRSFRGL